MSKWVTQWACAQCDSQLFVSPLAGKTLRFTIENHMVGEAVRVRLANFYGKNSVRVERASINIDGQHHKLTVDGNEMFVVEKNASATTDPVPYKIEKGCVLEVRIYTKDEVISGSTTGTQKHSICGDYTQTEVFEQETNQCRLVLGEDAPVFGEPVMLIQGIDVLTADDAYAVAAFGDSITQMGFWFNPMKEAIVEKSAGKNTALNIGISGNRLLRGVPEKHIFGEGFGDAAVIRVYHDLLDLSGIKKVIIALGVNDITIPGSRGPGAELMNERPSVDQMLRGFQLLTRILNGNGIDVYAATITPFGGFDSFSEETENMRVQVNEWIRTCGIFAGVFDFAEAVCDPSCKNRMDPKYDSGDHLHPNPQGGLVMAQCIKNI